MSTFSRRLIGAARLDPATYEEVEADARATGQACAVVLLSSIASGIGQPRLGIIGSGSLVMGAVGALVGWLAWAGLTYLIGTRLLPEPQTRSNVGELMRTLGFAASPGLLQLFGAIPGLGPLVFLIVQVWMLAATVVAVRQALDFTSTARAVGVCVVGWGLALVLALLMAGAFPRVVS